MSAYPASVQEILSDIVFRPSTLRAVERFRQTNPWQGNLMERRAKFVSLHIELCKIYGLPIRLTFGRQIKGSSAHSTYFKGTITLQGRLSVITYLHEMGHALGRGEKGACRWSVNLFRQCFPERFQELKSRGHMLEKK